MPCRLTGALLALTLFTAACDSLDAFDADRGSYSATVRGAETYDLDGSGYLSGRITDDPPTSSVVLTNTDGPTIEFQVPGDLEARRYAFPDEARATFEVERYVGDAYVANGGAVEVTAVSETRAVGTFSFTASRGSAEITVEGQFVAENR